MCVPSHLRPCSMKLKCELLLRTPSNCFIKTTLLFLYSLALCHWEAQINRPKKNVILGILPRMFPSTAQCILHKDPWEKFLLGLIIRKTCSAYNWHSSVSFFLFTIKGSLLLITFGGQEAQSYLGTVYCNKSSGLHLMVCILTFTFPPIFSFHKLLSPVTPLTISFISWIFY